MTKITGGTNRNRKLKNIPGDWIRPTMGRVREALFSMLGSTVDGARVLDLFAGCGVLGLEALSRGAGEVVFVDENVKSVRLIRENLALCRLEERGRVVRGRLPGQTVLRAVAHHVQEGEGFDLLFLDPPYKKDLVVPTIEAVREYGLVRNGGVVVAEHEAGLTIESVLTLGETWLPLQNRRYGDTRITLLRYNEQ